MPLAELDRGELDRGELNMTELDREVLANFVEAILSVISTFIIIAAGSS